MATGTHKLILDKLAYTIPIILSNKYERKYILLEIAEMLSWNEKFKNGPNT